MGAASASRRRRRVDGPVRVGGQAVIEGVMMRAGDRACVAVRRPDGTIESRPVAIPGWANDSAHLPFIRGLAALAEAMSVGIGALRWSEERALPPRDDGRRPAPVWVLLGIALAAVITLIVVIPAFLAGLVPEPWFAAAETSTRIGVAGGYVALVGRRADVRRVFEYHGAEHLVVAAHEAGRPLTAAGARAGSIRHPRCGTSFIVVIAVVAAAVHPLLPVEPWGDRVLSRIVVVPVVAMIAYEILTALGTVAARHPGGAVERLLVWPQRFTTRWPGDDQIEVAAVALRGALAQDTAQVPDATNAPTTVAVGASG